MLKELLLYFFVFCAVALGLQSCGGKPFACIKVEGNEDSIHVNQPVTINGYCSSNANEYNWQVDLDSIYFTPRFTISFPTAGEKEIYLFVANRGKSAAAIKKITVRP